jgi:hypothetical protein
MFDPLSPEQLANFADICRTILADLDPRYGITPDDDQHEDSDK